jgi:hypothetical protein
VNLNEGLHERRIHGCFQNGVQPQTQAARNEYGILCRREFNKNLEFSIKLWYETKCSIRVFKDCFYSKFMYDRRSVNIQCIVTRISEYGRGLDW